MILKCLLILQLKTFPDIKFLTYIATENFSWYWIVYLYINWKLSLILNCLLILQLKTFPDIELFTYISTENIPWYSIVNLY